MLLYFSQTVLPLAIFSIFNKKKQISNKMPKDTISGWLVAKLPVMCSYNIDPSLELGVFIMLE